MPRVDRRARQDRPARRSVKRTVLLVTNGKVTERLYLNELKRRARNASQDLRVEVKCIEGEPVTMLRKLTSPKGDSSGYDEIWIVVEEDGNDREPVLAECRRRTTKKQKWYCVVSRPCFETWLIAHYEQVQNHRDQHAAQRHWFRVSGMDDGSKKLPGDFPFDAMVDAVDRSRLPGSGAVGVNEMPPSPGSGMPALLEALGLLNDRSAPK